MNKEIIKKKMGRPTKYNEEMLKKANEYYLKCLNSEEVPYIERLALTLDVDDERITDYSRKYTNFNATIKRIKTLQKLKLQELTISTGKGAAIGAIFQLKANHGMIETEKQMHVGANNESLNVIFTDSKEKTEANSELQTPTSKEIKNPVKPAYN